MRERERIPSRLSVELMTTGHITPEQKAASNFFPAFWDNYGWDGGTARFGIRIPRRTWSR